MGEVDLLLLQADMNALPVVDWQSLHEKCGLAECVQTKPRGDRWPWNLVRRWQPKLVDRLAHNFGRKGLSYLPEPAALARSKAMMTERHYDLVVGRHLLPTISSGAFSLGIPVIVDIDDLETQVYQDRLSSPATRYWQRVIVRHHLQQLQQIVPNWLQQARHLWFSCPEDIQNVNHPHASVLPNIPFERASKDPVEEATLRPHVILTVGSLDHPPNARGVEWLLTNVWPLIHSALPSAILRIVGGGARPDHVQRWKAVPHVEVVGFVSDLPSEYRRASAVVAAQFEGGGTKIKVLEALEYGCATVVTPHALRGYGHTLKSGDSILVGTNAAEFAYAVVRLLKSPRLAREIGARGAEIVAREFSNEMFNRLVRATVERVV